MEPIDKSEALKVWLEEYKALSADIQNRVTLQHGLMNFLLLIVSASAVVIGSVLKDNLIHQYQSEIKLLLMVLPILFFFFVWRHANHDLNIIDKAAYINHTLRPNVVAITGDASVLGFERFLERARQRRHIDFGALIWWGGEHSFHLIFSAIALVGAFAAFLSGKGPLVFGTTARELLEFAVQDTLLALDVVLFYLTVKLKKKVGYAYGSIVKRGEDVWC
jgi:hypothetical protein